METRASFAPIVFLLHTALCQTIALAVTIIIHSLTGSLISGLLAGSILSGASAQALSLSLPWQLLNFILPCAVASSFLVEIPSWLFLALFLAMLFTYLPAFWTRVPYYPTPRAAYALVLAELPREREFRFLDIGCGMGEMLVFLAKQRPAGSFIGIEIGLIPFLVSWSRARLSGRRNVHIRYQSMWRHSLSEYDFVYAFLSPAPMSRLWEKVTSEMKPESLFISNTFPAPSEATAVISVKDARKSSLYLYPKLHPSAATATASVASGPL
jgi:hypothetical protein